jgi:hypothetical protein
VLVVLEAAGTPSQSLVNAMSLVMLERCYLCSQEQPCMMFLPTTVENPRYNYKAYSSAFTLGNRREYQDM